MPLPIPWQKGPTMTLFNRAQYEQLIHNGSFKTLNKDPQPVVKLQMEGAGCTWLLSELNPDDTLMAFGLYDLGMQAPELGYINLSTLQNYKLPLSITLEQDPEFIGLYPISVYARAAKACGYITEDQDILRRHQLVVRRTGLYPI